MKFNETNLTGSFLISLDEFQDERGFFARFFCKTEFSNMNLNFNWAQINNSFSKSSGTLRGLHYQMEPNSEIKLVRCIKGAIWDVIVDLRVTSSTFGKWFGVELNDSNRTMIYIPKGFAHGFITLSPDSEVLYLASDFYEPKSEQVLLWNDPDISIDWPIKPEVLSQRDKFGKTLKNLNLIMGN
jgi:dTDP-4-dehydrorhamnose 3,5-epimerase